MACRAGSLSEALSSFQSASELAAEAKKRTPYERLAHPWSGKIRQAYQRALVGARLMRKLVVLNGRAYVAAIFAPGELEALSAE
ncbi:MAG TPA: hypothetical protein VGF67_14415 [Ktedonobacteraceae bacterium]|jgi:hypothetical protein